MQNRPGFSQKFRALVIVASALAWSAVASPALWAEPVQIAQAKPAQEGIGDPLEPINRVIFAFNEFFYAMLLRPVSELYRGFVPPPIRRAVGNVLDNLRTPIVLANDLLQGEAERAWQTTQRFAINTTLGVGGIVDRAEEIGIAKHKEDFGQTLAVWGVGEGFFLVLPLLGPSSPRDAVGKHFVDGYFDPFGMWIDNTDRDAVMYGRSSADAVDAYAGGMDELARVKKTSIDYYAAMRSLYRQKRQADIRNSATAHLPLIPDIDYELTTTPSR